MSLDYFRTIGYYIKELPDAIDKAIDETIKEQALLSEQASQQTIIKHNRIDTGLMLKTVRAETIFERYKKTYSLISDQFQEKKIKGVMEKIYYSDYQEYGTKNGIKGIFFVEKPFFKAVDNIEEDFEKRLQEVNNEVMEKTKSTGRLYG
jgi:hypothetical protein